jgi:hypothetical protein
MAAAAVLAAVATTGCSERGTSQPAPGQTGPNPNLGTVPPRPIATPTADRAALLGALQRDRDQARHDVDMPAIDETRGSTIGALVSPGQGRNDARAAASPAPELRVEGGPPRAGGPPAAEGATVGPPRTQQRAPIQTEDTPSPPSISVPTPAPN